MFVLGLAQSLKTGRSNNSHFDASCSRFGAANIGEVKCSLQEFCLTGCVLLN